MQQKSMFEYRPKVPSIMTSEADQPWRWRQQFLPKCLHNSATYTASHPNEANFIQLWQSIFLVFIRQLFWADTRIGLKNTPHLRSRPVSLQFKLRIPDLSCFCVVFEFVCWLYKWHLCCLTCMFLNTYRIEWIWIIITASIITGVRCGAVGWGTALQTERSRLDSRYILEFFRHYPFGRTMKLRSTQPRTQMSTRNISWGGG